MSKVRLASPDTQRRHRLPPGQVLTKKFPVLSITPPPLFDPATWLLRVWGEVAEPYTLTWVELRQLPAVELLADFHCVTGWSRLDNLWEGAPARLITERARPKAEATAVTLHCADGYTANLPLPVFLAEDVIFAYRHEGEELSLDHGGPLRLIVPQRYGWKSAKYVIGLEFMAEERLGFWERRGYHRDGDQWREQRYWGD